MFWRCTGHRKASGGVSSFRTSPRPPPSRKFGEDEPSADRSTESHGETKALQTARKHPGDQARCWTPAAPAERAMITNGRAQRAAAIPAVGTGE
jgi:hypothetical protein